MKKIYRKPVTKAIVIEDSLLMDTSQGEGQPSYKDDVNLDLDLNPEDEGYAD